MKKVRILAFYLPQYHPIPENDKWWGKGFTEWTNVGKAKPLFKGHYQPKVPADLGYYDLRIPEIREAQAEMAAEYGVEGFCYWHYWFGDGKVLLDRPFKEVLSSKKPDFPICLAWANHSWEDKLFNKEGSKKVLMKQTYPGKEDYIKHFQYVLPAFQDDRYIKVDGKPLFVINCPFDVPNISDFIGLWNQLAKENGLNGIHFVGQTFNERDVEPLKKLGFDGINIVRLFHFFRNDFSFFEKVYMKFMRYIWGKGRLVHYKRAYPFFIGEEESLEYCYPTLIPNWDHSPRSGRKGHILVDAEPSLFKNHVKEAIKKIEKKEDEHKVIFLKSWNEWAEGNYMEPDLKYGKGYLEALKKGLSED
ncbi:glycoside hydrolase family 99-like domain-containing protein [Parabacteroides sp. OttesenSCG-928-O15]|nr:glycoside hydrolase family 99-like domain-containing protein [Parabacteroides sp. OttesenSCG-928-O15]